MASGEALLVVHQDPSAPTRPTVSTAAATRSDATTETLQPLRGYAVALGGLIAIVGIYAAVQGQMVGRTAADLPWTVLFALAALMPLLSRLRFTRRDAIVVFMFLLVAFNCIDSVNRFLPTITTLPYFATPENSYQEMWDRHIPRWFAPTDTEAIRQFWEGSYETRPSLRPWLAPMGRWLGFFMVMWATLFCVVALLRRHWVEDERLGFPLVTVPLYIMSAGTGRMQPRRSIWSEPLVWLGFGVASAHFLSIMMHGLNPGFPTLGRYTDIGRLFTERPWNALQPLWFVYRPLYTGLGYFAPQDLCFSMWFFFLVWVESIKVGYAALGIPLRDWLPYTHQQTAGSFFALALLLGWTGRGYLRRLWEAVLVGTPLAGESDHHPWADPLRPRLAAIGAAVGFAVLCGWYIAAGLSFWVAVLFFAMIFLFAFIFTRGRAETGVYAYYLTPFLQASQQMTSWLGSRPLMPGGSPTNLVLLTQLVYLHFGFFPENMTFQIESLKLGEECRLRTSQVSWLVIIAMLVGLITAFGTYLTTALEVGALAIGGRDVQGGWWASEVRGRYNEVDQVMKGNPMMPDWNRNGYTLVGFVLSLLLAGVRRVFPRSPLNPLGYALTVHYGVILWGPFFVTWLAKAIILRLGGGRLYHRLTPFFVGLVIGELFSVGVVWNVFAAFTNEEWRTLAAPVQG